MMQDNRLAMRGAARSLSLVVVAIVLELVGGILAARSSLAQEAEVLAQGQLYFQQYCAACHGRSATGDGPVAPLLKVTPADLTQIRRRNGGAFPEWRVYRVIHGQEEVKGHGTREMPIWGRQFQLEIQEEQAETRAFRAVGRILVLGQYLRSIQAP